LASSDVTRKGHIRGEAGSVFSIHKVTQTNHMGLINENSRLILGIINGEIQNHIFEATLEKKLK